MALFYWSIAFSTSFWRYQVAILNLCFIEASLNFLLYHMQKHFFRIFMQKKVAKFLSGPKKRPYKTVNKIMIVPCSQQVA